MSELQATTPAGADFVALAEKHAEDFATRAAQHDREGSFPVENFEAMKASGFLAAPVPVELGGMGMTSGHDLAVGLSRLARGCGSTAIAANMHLSVASTMWRMRTSEPDGPLAAAIEGMQKGIAAGQILTAVPATEAGTDISHPQTTATPNEQGYLLNGTKIFGTLSPVANLFFSSVRVAQPDGSYRPGMAFVFRGTPGMEIKDNWDALGMRASGSSDIVYTDCQLPGASVNVDRDTGSETAGSFGVTTAIGLEMGIAGNLGLVGSFLGIAEAARDMVIAMAKTRRKLPSNRLLAERHSVQYLAGELEVDLAICRAMIDRAGRLADDYVARYPRRQEAPLDAALELSAEFHATKLVAQRRAIEAVDKAMTLSGGAGYMNKHPLSRLYRDVRAGPFMQPFAPNEALEYIGKIALGQPPEVDR